jgi:hypothetical protein
MQQEGGNERGHGGALAASKAGIVAAYARGGGKIKGVREESTRKRSSREYRCPF